MKEQEKRKPRSYKAKDSEYCKSVRRAWRYKTTLVNILETVVSAYAKGHDIYYIDKNGNKQVVAE